MMISIKKAVGMLIFFFPFDSLNEAVRIFIVLYISNRFIHGANICY